MKRIKGVSIYLCIMIFAFYGLPFLIRDTGSGIFFLLIMIPIICFLTSFIYGIKHSFNWLYPLLIMLLFIPSLFLFYNDSAAIYVLLYGAIATIGNFLGSLFKHE